SPYTTLFRSDGSPDGVAHAHVESEQCEAEKESADGAAHERGKRPSGVGESVRLAGGQGHRDFEDRGDAEVDPMHGDGSFDLVSDRKSTRLNSSHVKISYAVFCLKKKKK